MQYKPEAEKVAMMGAPYTLGVQSVPLADDPQVQRTRKIFMIIVGVCLALCVISLVGTFFGSGTSDGPFDARQAYKIAQPLLSLLFYGFGLFAAHRYSTIGLRIFAWIGIVLLVIMGIAILVLLVIAILALVAVGTVKDEGAKNFVIAGSVVAFIIIAVYVVAFILSVIIVKFAFKLARLIDANKRVVTQQL